MLNKPGDLARDSFGGMPDQDTGELDLDALLADSMQVQNDKKNLAKENKRVQQSLDKTNQVRDWRLANAKSSEIINGKRDWQPVAAVALFHTQRCVTCGTNHTHFMGVFQRQKYVAGGVSGFLKADQWVRATDHTMIDNLPKEQKVTDEPVDMCECCAPSLGYPPKLFA